MNLAPLIDGTRNRHRLLVLALMFSLVDLVQSLVRLDVSISHSEKTGLYREMAPALFLIIGETPWLAIAVGAGGAVGLLGFALNRRPILSALVLLFSLFLLSESHRAAWGGPSRAMYAQGAVLLGWLGGMVIGSRLGRGSAVWKQPQEEWVQRLGEWGGLGVLAAYYMNAGLSKVTASGLDWFSSDNLRSVVVVQSAQSPDVAFAPYVEWVVANPSVCQALAVGTVVVEVGAFALLFGRGVRCLWAVLLLLIHINIGLLTGSIWYTGPMILLVAYMLPMKEMALPRVSAMQIKGIAAVVGGIVLMSFCVAWLTPMGDYTREAFLESEDETRGPGGEVHFLSHAGPFTVGDRVVSGWRVHALQVRGKRLRVICRSGEEGELVFVFEKENDSDAQSPFVLPSDLPPFWFYYERTERGFPEIQAVGNTLLRVLERACGGQVRTIGECLPVLDTRPRRR